MPTDIKDETAQTPANVTPIRPIIPPVPTPPRRPSFSFPWSHAFAFLAGAVAATYISSKLRGRNRVRYEYDDCEDDDSEDE